MPNSAIAVATFVLVLLAMLTVGSALQVVHPQFGLIASELSCILLPALVVAYATSRSAEPPPFPRVRRLGIGAGGLIWVLGTSAALGFAANAVTGLLASTVPSLHDLADAYDQMFRGLMFPDDPVARAAAIAAIVVAAPVCEETLFRGVLLPLLRDGRPLAAALVFDGVLFSLLHVNPLGFLALVAIGTFFAHVAVITESIWPPILAHAMLNFVNGVIAPAVVGHTGLASDPSVLEYAVSAVGSVAIVGVSWGFGARAIRRRRRNDA